MKLSKSFSRLLLAGLTIGSALAAFTGCGGSREESAADKERNRLCKPVETAKVFDETPFTGGTAVIISYENIRAQINTSCASCHKYPARNHDFSYRDEMFGAEMLVDGRPTWIPGFAEAAEQIRNAIFDPDEEVKRMPPKKNRGDHPEVFLKLGQDIDAWIQAGKPKGTFQVGSAPEQRRGKLRMTKPHGTSELGDCVPVAEAVGSDFELDHKFEKWVRLPKYLSETDLYTLDPLDLARSGTFAYNVEYPLWADNADKGRWIHVPKKLVGDKVEKQSIKYNPETKQFDIPDNTRFYKTFYRAVKLPNGRTKMRRMETRLIVSRPSVKNADGTIEHKALFGTYLWDETEQVAVLVETPYRDGTPWADVVMKNVISDIAKEKTRTYAIPGKVRCIDCHMGSPTQNFVLGFQPLQINKRPWGAAGRLEIPAEHDLDQVRRFLDYGLISGIKSAAELPVLEKSGGLPASNDHELRANGYMVGNCFHCHNKDGLAKTAGVSLTLGPGDIFQFNPQRQSDQNKAFYIVDRNGELDASLIWSKVANGEKQLVGKQMPMHTPASPDCKVLTVMGKWIQSFNSVEAADAWLPSCKTPEDVFWVPLDLTWPISDHYEPRRKDWAAPSGMPQKFRDLVLTPDLQKAFTDEYAVGHWLDPKKQCKFPEVDLPPEKQRPWMFKDNKPGNPLKKPYGEVYYTTPGAYIFRMTCYKCHGQRADGHGPLAAELAEKSGGEVRVADFMGDNAGMFGNKTENLKTFDLNGRNLAGNYLIWMAMEGTQVPFPPSVSELVGKHGAQMLKGLRDKCAAYIHPKTKMQPHILEYEIVGKICFMNNLYPDHPDLAFDPATDKPVYPDRMEQWLDLATMNGGWSVFEFLRDAALTGKWRPTQLQCEMLYPKNPN